MKKLLCLANAIILLFTITTSAVADNCIVPTEYTAEDKSKALYLSSLALTELAEASYTEIQLLTSSVEYGYSSLILNGQEPVWIVTYSTFDDVVRFRVLLGANGEFLDYSLGDHAFSNTETLPSNTYTHGFSDISHSDSDVPSFSEFDLYNSQGIHFYSWSHEERKAFSDKWRTAFHDFLSTSNNKEFYEGSTIGLFTQRAYGVPDQQAIDEAAVLIIAREAIKDIEGSPSVNEPLQYVSVYYDVTDPGQPQWRIYCELEYFVIIDAYSGEIIDALHTPCEQTDLIDLLILSKP